MRAFAQLRSGTTVRSKPSVSSRAAISPRLKWPAVKARRRCRPDLVPSGSVAFSCFLNDRSRKTHAAAWGHEATIVAARANWLALQLRAPAMEHAHCTTTIHEPWKKARRSESAVQAQRDLGDPGPLAARQSSPRFGAVQPSHRQQASSLRPGQTARPKRLPRRRHGIPGDRVAAENPRSGTVRDYRADAGGCRSLDRSCKD